MDFSKIDIENNQNKTAELVPFSIKKSTVLLETNTHTNNTSNNIKYISAIDNNKIICTNCILPSATQYFAYAETNSNIVIDDNSLIKKDNKQKYGQFIANKNSFINYNLNIKNTDTTYLPLLYNNGEKYITYTFNKTDVNNSVDVNNVYYVPEKNDKTIQINVAQEETLSGTIEKLQKEIDSIPSVLNGYTLEINLSVLGGYKTNFSINTPLKIKNFYQGKIKIIFDKAMGEINFMPPNSKINFADDLNITYDNSNDDQEKETYRSFNMPLLIISDVDNCEFYSTASENGNIVFKLSNPPAIDKNVPAVIPMIIINNVNNFETNCNITFKSNLGETAYKTYNLISTCNSLRKFNTCIYDFICGIYFKLTTAKLKQIIINEQPIHCALFNDFSTIYADELLIGYNMTLADYR